MAAAVTAAGAAGAAPEAVAVLDGLAVAADAAAGIKSRSNEKPRSGGAFFILKLLNESSLKSSLNLRN